MTITNGLSSALDRELADIEATEFSADEIAEALRLPDNFGAGRELRERGIGETWSLGPVIEHRDSGILDRSNARVLLREIERAEKEGVIEPDSWEADDASHWAVGHVTHLTFRVIDDAGAPTRVARWLKRWNDALADYPVADDSDHSELECEVAHETIKYLGETIIRRMDWDPPELGDEAWSQVHRHLDEPGTLDRDDTDGIRVSEEQIREALEALGYLFDPEDAASALSENEGDTAFAWDDVQPFVALVDGGAAALHAWFSARPALPGSMVRALDNWIRVRATPEPRPGFEPEPALRGPSTPSEREAVREALLAFYAPLETEVAS